MGDKSKILWCDATWNPVAGCSVEPISEGCQNCYARQMANRMGGEKQHFHGLTEKHGHGWSGKINFYPDILLAPLRWVKPRQIFVGSMGDLFYERVSDDLIDQVFGVIAACSVQEDRNHRFLILTKRPERLRQYLVTENIEKWIDYASSFMLDGKFFLDRVSRVSWPFENLWIGTSAENQEQFDKRIPEILKTPAIKRFVSIEPMLGPIGLSYLVDWVICGGESGPRGRPLHPDWVRRLRDQCAALDIPFMFKQWGMWKPVDWYEEATHAIRTDGYVTKFGNEPLSISRAKKPTAGWQGIAKLGKTKAGRELDGEIHTGSP
jgi:protein gp37